MSVALPRGIGPRAGALARQPVPGWRRKLGGRERPPIRSGYRAREGDATISEGERARNEEGHLSGAAPRGSFPLVLFAFRARFTSRRGMGHGRGVAPDLGRLRVL